MTGRLDSAKRVLVVGTSGSIARALRDEIAKRSDASVITTGRDSGATKPAPDIALDFNNAATVASAAAALGNQGPLDAIIVATGLLHAENIHPERSYKQVNAEAMQEVLRVNAVVPALVAAHFLPLIPRDANALFAALSARVGSISDNQLGGWYSYRSSKAALNMFIKTLAIEWQHSHRQCTAIGLHPGTVASELSAPFQKNLPAGQLQDPETAAGRLYDVMNGARLDDSGHCLDYRGKRIPA